MWRPVDSLEVTSFGSRLLPRTLKVFEKLEDPESLLGGEV